MANYILNNLLNDVASYNFRQMIDNKFDSISSLPDSGTFLINILDDISPVFAMVQRRVAKKYIIVYRYYEEDNIAFITHVFHESQDYGRLFQN